VSVKYWDLVSLSGWWTASLSITI